MRIKFSFPTRYFVSHGMQYGTRIIQIMSNMHHLWYYNGQLYENTTKRDASFARRCALKRTFKQAILHRIKYSTRRRNPKLCQMMPLCKYVYEYATPEHGSFTIKLALNAAFWHTRLCPQKVVLESSMLHHLLYYQIWQFYETMWIAQEVILSINGRHLNIIWCISMSGRNLCPIGNPIIWTIMPKTKKMTKTTIAYGDNSGYLWDLFDYQSDSSCAHIPHISHG